MSLNERIKSALNGCDIELKRLSHVPFGVYWYRDIRFFSNGKNLQTVLDVGANVGQTALTLVKHFPRARVFCFEPVPTTFDVLRSRTSDCRDVECFNFALGELKGVGKVTDVPLSGSNTLLVEASSATASKKLVEVGISTVDSFCSEKGIDGIDLLKIDTEGYEMNVLRGANSLLSDRRIQFILAECDFFRRSGEPHGDFGELYSFLRDYGFNVVSFYTGGVDDMGWVWGNVLFRQTEGCTAGVVSSSPARVPAKRIHAQN